VTHVHSLLLSPAFTNPAVACPAGHPNCTRVSIPVLANDIFFQNRTFHMSAAGSPAVVVLAPSLSQTATGVCPSTGFNGSSGPQYWDIGVYGDSSVMGGNPGGYAMSPTYSILTSLSGPGGGYGGATSHNIAGPATGTGSLVVSQYCNGSRVPPEISTTLCAPPVSGSSPVPGCTYPGAVGITVPPNVPDINPFYASFTLTPAATVDEGNNAISMFYGPLTTVNATIQKGAAGYGVPLGNYSPIATSPAVNAVPASVAHPALDFYGNPRPDGTTTSFDIGAVEIPTNSGTILPNAVVRPAAALFGNVRVGTASTQPVTVSNPGATALVINGLGVGGPGVNADEFTVSKGNCPIGGAGLPAGGTCTATVTFRPTSQGAQSATLNVTVAGH
jgi:hypothetical protein